MKFWTSTFTILLQIFIYLIQEVSNEDINVASKHRAEHTERIRCGYHLINLWVVEVAHTTFAAAPLITDVDADGNLDIVTAPLSESLTVLVGETGKVLPNTRWPAQKLDSSIHASPIQVDIDGDGLLDLLFTTSSGELLFYHADGTPVSNKHFELKSAYVKEDWYQTVISASSDGVGNFVTGYNPHIVEDRSYIPVDAHVLATPVLADVNNDDRIEELVMPVSYYFEEDDYRSPESFEHINKINSTDLDKYLVGGITIVNITSLSVITTMFFELTKRGSDFPAYVLFSPTVLDMDGSSGELEIVIGTSAGGVHVVDLKGNYRKGFPQSINSLHGQITVADINKDSNLELITVDTSGNVVCFNDDGTITWEAEISGTSSPGSRVLDIDGDSYLDVVITTNSGDVYAISGVNGTVLPKWPIRVGKPIQSNILATKLSTKHKALDLVFLSEDGLLHIVSADQTCRTHYPIYESSLVQILSHDIVTQSEGNEILISTNDGTVICMGTGNELEERIIDDEENKKTIFMSLPAETKSPNDFLFSVDKGGIYAHHISRTQPEISGSHFYISFEITDPLYHQLKTPPNAYQVKVYFGSSLLLKRTYSVPGEYHVFVPAPSHPSHGHVTLQLTNQYGQIFKDIFPLKSNKVILEDLQWLLMAPFIAMTIILLVNHGFPAKDLLPVTLNLKHR